MNFAAVNFIFLFNHITVNFFKKNKNRKEYNQKKRRTRRTVQKITTIND